MQSLETKTYESTEPLTSPANVLFVFDGNYDCGNGVSTYIRTIGDFLESNGSQVDYIVGQSTLDDKHIHTLGRSLDIPINGSTAGLPLPVSRRAIAEVLDTLKPDAIHVQVPYIPFLAGRVIEAADPSARIIGTFHTVAETFKARQAHRFGDLSTRQTIGRFDHMFSVSDGARETAEKFFGLESEVLAPPIDIEHLEQGQRLPEYDDGKTNIAFLGRLVDKKGCRNLLEAVGLIGKQRLSNTRVLIAGDGPLRADLEEYAKNAGLGETVTFLGSVDHQKRDILASADLVVFPTIGAESFGIVLTEAMAASHGAVLASNNRGYRQVLQATPRALFDATDTTQLARMISELMDDAAARTQIADIQHTEVQTYDVRGRIGQRIIEAYNC